MKIETKAVHAGDRKRNPKRPDEHIPVTTPISTAVSYFYQSAEKLDAVMGHEEEGFSYSRYGNPTSAALEELIAELEGGAGALACASGMTAVQTALIAALTDRPKKILAATALYGATINLLTKILEPLGVTVDFVDTCNLPAVEAKLSEIRPGCILLETISNPLLRVAEIDRISAIARKTNTAVVIDNTFATPLLVRPLELGANLVVHSVTKFLAGHGDVLGGVVVGDAEHVPILQTLSRTIGPVLGPFESYLTMRGIKTFALRVERQCSNACRVASSLASNPVIGRVHYPANPDHPDAAAIRRLLPPNLYGAILSFEIKDAGKAEIFRFMDRLRLIVPATSLGDVHSLLLYPVMASHRDISPKQRERMGIRDNLVRLCVGIEAVEDVLADLRQALQ